MTNGEFYKEEIKNYKNENFCKDFVQPKILKKKDCYNVKCVHCHMLSMAWMMEEYEEPKINWKNVPVDTPILVKDAEDKEWVRRYFAKYDEKNEKVGAWIDGTTSWSTDPRYKVCYWNEAQLVDGDC